MYNANNFISGERSTLKKLVRLIQKDPFSHEEAPNGHQELIWYINPVENKEEFNYLIHLIISLGFRLTREEQKSYVYRHIFSESISLHITILQFVDKYTINAHIDVGIHEGIIRNRLTVELLSVLHGLLKQRYPIIPILLRSFSQPRRLTSKKEGAKRSIDSEYMQRKVSKVVNKITPLVIIEAARESLQKRMVVSKKEVKTIIYDHIKSESDLDLADNLVRNKVEININQQLDQVVDKIRYSYQKQRNGPQKSIKKKVRKGSPQNQPTIFQVEPDEGYIRKRNRVDDSYALFKSRLISKEHKSPTVTNNIPEPYNYEQEIKKYVNEFCYSTLFKELKTHYMDEDEMRRGIIKKLNKKLKTVSHTSRDIYRACFATYLNEHFAPDYEELVNELYYVPEPRPEPTPDKPAIFEQWVDDNPIRILVVFFDIILVLIISAFIGDYTSGDFIPIILLATSIVFLTGWIVVSFIQYCIKKYKNRDMDKE